jgi:hypothetical protein
MPGGSTPTGPLAAGNCSILDPCFNTYLSPQGRINNVLISQTITLSLNIRLTSGTGILSTLQLGSGCIITSGGSFTINQSVIAYLGGSATVQDLLNLANDVLGGVKTPGVGGVPSYSAINDAVTAINEGFDECRTLYGYCTPAVTVSNAPRPTGQVSKAAASTLEVSSYPNPFSDNVRFTIRSTTSGRGTLEVYDMAGAKLQVVYSGYIYSGKGQTIDYRVPVLYRRNLMYVLRMGDKIVTGKLINIR